MVLRFFFPANCDSLHSRGTGVQQQPARPLATDKFGRETSDGEKKEFISARLTSGRRGSKIVSKVPKILAGSHKENVG